MSDENKVETEEVETVDDWRPVKVAGMFFGGVILALFTALWIIPMLLNYHRPLPDGWTMQYNAETKLYRYVRGDGWRGWSEHSTKWGCTKAAWEEAESLIKQAERDKHWEAVPAHVVTNCTVVTNPPKALDIGKDVQAAVDRLTMTQFDALDQEICSLEKRVTKLELEGRSNMFWNLPNLGAAPLTRNVEAATNNIAAATDIEVVAAVATNWNVCPKCGGKYVAAGWEMTTSLVGYNDGTGHGHDPNCTTRIFTCVNGHHTTLGLKWKCSRCSWEKAGGCFCHEGPKLDEWPPIGSPYTLEATNYTYNFTNSLYGPATNSCNWITNFLFQYTNSTILLSQ